MGQFKVILVILITSYAYAYGLDLLGTWFTTGLIQVMLDFHMEREHGKRQADALLLNRKGMGTSHDCGLCSSEDSHGPWSRDP